MVVRFKHTDVQHTGMQSISSKTELRQPPLEFCFIRLRTLRLSLLWQVGWLIHVWLSLSCLFNMWRKCAVSGYYSNTNWLTAEHCVTENEPGDHCQIDMRLHRCMNVFGPTANRCSFDFTQFNHFTYQYRPGFCTTHFWSHGTHGSDIPASSLRECRSTSSQVGWFSLPKAQPSGWSYRRWWTGWSEAE